MNSKIKSLTEKVYKDFILGVYGTPIIPTINQVTEKVATITNQDYVPITIDKPMEELDIDFICSQFSNIIDDITILYDAVELESRSIYEQLDASIKEHKGVNRELIQINNYCSNITSRSQYKTGLVITQDFSSLNNINLSRSSQINLNSSNFSLRPLTSKILSFTHYYGKKLDFTVYDYQPGALLSTSYVGQQDVKTILDPMDDRGLTYVVKMDSNVSLKAGFILIANPQKKPVKINKISVNLDTTNSSGMLRVYYKHDGSWVDIPGETSIKDFSTKITYNFPSIDVTYLKFEFIKDKADNDNNEYIFSITNLSVSLTKSVKTAVCVSKPIDIEEYKFNAHIDYISANINGDIPAGNKVKLYVASDPKISGYFVDEEGNKVSYNSSSAVSFVNSGLYTTYLSEIQQASYNVSGIDNYINSDFDWKEIKTDYSLLNVNDIVSFTETKTKPLYLNTLSNIDSSASGSIANDYNDGWYRPYVAGQEDNVVPDITNTPDFFVNNNKFYKIYRFNYDTKVIPESITLNTYPHIPFGYKTNKHFKKTQNTTNYLKNTTVTLNNSSGNYYYYLNSSGYGLNKIVTPFNSVSITDSSINLLNDYDYHIMKTSSGLKLDLNPFIISKNYLPSGYVSGIVPIDINFDYKKDTDYPYTYSIYILKTDDEAGEITLSGVLGTKEFSIRNLDTNKVTNIKRISEKQTLPIVGNKNKLSFKWKDYDDVTIPKISGTSNIRTAFNLNSMEYIEFNTLLNNGNDNNFSIFNDIDGYQYIVVKEPNIKTFTPYYNYDYNIMRDSSGNVYTTGSSGRHVYKSLADVSGNAVHAGWNSGYTEKRNTNQNIYYANHPGYVHLYNKYDYEYDGNICVGTDYNISGFLYYYTGINLPSYYSISYKYETGLSKTTRFLYKLEITAETKVPEIYSIEFKINEI